jgi:hypothetical protein
MKKSMLAVALTICVASSAAAADHAKFKKHSGGAPGKWIVAFADGVKGDNAARKLTEKYGAKLRYVYEHALNGFAVEMTEAAAEKLSRDPHVSLVEQDAIVVPTAVQTGTPVYWGLDRIDQTTGSADGQYVYNRTGTGVRIYIVDSGISSYDEFYRRLIHGYTVAYFDTWAGPQPNYDDAFCNDFYRCHGSKVASIAGGSLYGVAKQATVINVKVTDWDHYTAGDVIGGLNYIINNSNQYPTQPAVANISLNVAGTFEQTLFEQAVINTIDSGVVVVAGAGNTSGYYQNSGSNACGGSPARLGKTWAGFNNPNNRTVITVASSSINGSRTLNAAGVDQNGNLQYWSSDFGECVDIFAPGDGVRARGISSLPPDEFAGTSAASPYVAGVVALYLEGRGSNYDPNAVEAAIKANATANALSNVGSGSPNLLIYSRVDLWP